jgi:hypothetical protein
LSCAGLNNALAINGTAAKRTNSAIAVKTSHEKPACSTYRVSGGNWRKTASSFPTSITPKNGSNISIKEDTINSHHLTKTPLSMIISFDPRAYFWNQ